MPFPSTDLFPGPDVFPDGTVIYQNVAGLVVGGTGQVYVGPVGAPLPTDATTPLNTAYQGLGYLTDEGVAVLYAPEFNDIPGWQASQSVRRARTSEAFSLAFHMLQWNEINVPVALGGGNVDQVAGGYRYLPPVSTDSVGERTMVCDIQDGTRRMRFVVPRGSVSDGAESKFSRTEAADLPVTFRALQPADSPAWQLFNG